ncbi:MAG: hypothetical protein R3F65_10605 [bacterium]
MEGIEDFTALVVRVHSARRAVNRDEGGCGPFRARAASAKVAA